MHELAHAKRHDVLTQTLAGLVCSLYWFNPLCWFGLAQMRKLRELACDDMVIASGQQPAEYASVLLDVARSYRHWNVTMAVGMARGTNVEHRILAALDGARNRLTLSRKAARGLLVGATAAVLLLGSMQLFSRGNGAAAQASEAGTEMPPSPGETPEAKAAKKAVEDQNPDGGVRTIEVSITDEAGKPLVGAKLYVSIWEVEGGRDFANTAYRTGRDGIAKVLAPRRLRILRLWPNKAGYIPEFVNFEEGTHDEGKLIPDRYKFVLEKGTELSGTIVDENGQPIPNVAVEVRVNVREPAWGANPEPIVSHWLNAEDFADGPVLTGADGRWKVVNAPAPMEDEDYEFYLKLTHENFVSDSQWGEIQAQQKITTKMLRDGTARIVMARGTVVTGTVVGPSGEPVKNGLVVWHDDPYGSSAVHEATIDGDGKFQTLPLAPREYPFTVIAPGFAPLREMVTVGRGPQELEISLEAGRNFAMKIVDQQGNPIPRAYVRIHGWHGAQSLYNDDHPSVPNSGIPRHANGNGVFAWTWAPEDKVTYLVSQKGFAPKEVRLAASEEEHVVTLIRALTAVGRVTDAVTGEPVKEFRVAPVIVHDRQELTTWFDAAAMGQDGSYEIELRGSSEPASYRVRVDADGYRSELSEESFASEDGLVTVDFALEPAAARKGLVLDADGRPAASATVVVATPSIAVSMINFEATHGGRPIRTTRDGTFELAATSEPMRILVIHDSQYAEVLRQPDEEIGTIQLQRCATVAGRLIYDGQPFGDQTIHFYSIRNTAPGAPQFGGYYSAQTDSEGRIQFKRLPPIAGRLQAYLIRTPPLESSKSVIHSIPLDLKPGEQREVTLGTDGVELTGTIVADGADEQVLSGNRFHRLVRRDAGISLPGDFPKLGFNPEGPLKAEWLLDPTFRYWLSTRETYLIKTAPNGQMHFGRLPPGQYDLVIAFYDRSAGFMQIVGKKVVPVEITQSDVAAGRKELGAIEVECTPGPRIGESMQLFEFIDGSGQKQRIVDMKGRYVLMHVWASWGLASTNEMRDIGAATKRFADQPITFVGFNIDKEGGRAKQVAIESGWQWPQTYLGENSETARRLALSLVPTYYLVGPDGRLATVTNDWPSMERAIEDALK